MRWDLLRLLHAYFSLYHFPNRFFWQKTQPLCILVQGDFSVLNMGLGFITSAEQILLKENKIQCIFYYQPSVIGKVKEWCVPATFWLKTGKVSSISLAETNIPCALCCVFMPAVTAESASINSSLPNRT